MQVKFQQCAGLKIEDIYKEDIDHAVLIQVMYASRKAFRGETQLFAKERYGRLDGPQRRHGPVEGLRAMKRNHRSGFDSDLGEQAR
jgi:hypothetical protein